MDAMYNVGDILMLVSDKCIIGMAMYGSKESAEMQAMRCPKIYPM